MSKKDNTFSTKEVSDFVQSEAQNILFECPKCDCPQTKIVGKKSYFGAIGGMLLGPILAFIGFFVIPIKIIFYILTFKFNKIKKMLAHELWSKYVSGLKCSLIIFTFGIVNITKVYECEKCGEKWLI